MPSEYLVKSEDGDAYKVENIHHSTYDIGYHMRYVYIYIHIHTYIRNVTLLVSSLSFLCLVYFRFMSCLIEFVNEKTDLVW